MKTGLVDAERVLNLATLGLNKLLASPTPVDASDLFKYESDKITLNRLISASRFIFKQKDPKTRNMTLSLSTIAFLAEI